MALESVSAAETLIQRTPDNDNDDLEDGEIPSDEDDDEVVPVAIPAPKPEFNESSKSLKSKEGSPKNKNVESSKSSKNKKQSSQRIGSGDRSSSKFNKGATEDWAGDVEKAIKAALDKDKSKHQESNSKSSKSSRTKSRKRSRDDKEEERIKEQKRRKVSDEENGNEDDDEMVFVRGASPIRKGSHENSSPLRRNNEHENYDSSSDYDDRSSSNRHRDNDNKRIGRGRRGGKNERGCKSKGRSQARNERNGRRNQTNNDHNQDPDAICVYYMQGKCHRGDDCPYSHNALPPRKMELCKFYLMDCCAKRDKCLYMHHDFPCKFFHTGLKCSQGENCKFSHQPLNEQVKNILLKHLETAPKEILGNFPRLSRDGALTMINNTEKNLAHGQEGSPKIPSLFELNIATRDEKDDDSSGTKDDSSTSGQQKTTATATSTTTTTTTAAAATTTTTTTTTTGKERKSSGKKTRWGSNEDRVPYEQIMLMQSVNQLGIKFSNAALDLAVQDQIQQQLVKSKNTVTMDFYNELNANDTSKSNSKEDFTKDVEEDEIRAQSTGRGCPARVEQSKDIDLRQMLTTTSKPPRVVSIADEIANITQSKMEEDSEEEESNLVIEMPMEEDEPEKEKDLNNLEVQGDKPVSPKSQLKEMLPNLPKKAQELFKRIQQQQREAQDSFKNLENENEEEGGPQDDWYSDDDDDKDDSGNLTIDEVHNEQDQQMKVETKIEPQSPPISSNIPQPAPFVDKLGDLSKIDISAEVSKLLSSLKAKSNAVSPTLSNSTSNFEDTDVKIKREENLLTQDNSKEVDKVNKISVLKQEKDNDDDDDEEEKTESFSPSSSPISHSQASVVSRDPRMLRDPRESREMRDSRDPRESRDSRDCRDPRDPRQRREEQRPIVSNKQNEVKDPRSHRLETTSIYSSAITTMDGPVDTDLRPRSDQDHRRKDMDLRQCFSDFGDTDLRLVGGNFTNSSIKSDIDLRQMLPFKPVPSHVPCTEIDGSIASHPPIQYKVTLIDIPRPDFTGLKLTKNDPQVKSDPRLRKIFRISLNDIADSPMSPPPCKFDTPKSPPPHSSHSHLQPSHLHPSHPPSQLRLDPRRKALETQSSQGGMNASIPQHHQAHSEMNMNMNMNPYMQAPVMQQNIPMMMNPNPMMANMNSMMGGGGGGPMGGSHMPMMGHNMGPNIGPNMQQNQMNFDPRFNSQRNNGVGILGPGPMGYGPESGQHSFDGGYSNGNFNNFPPGPGDPRNFPPQPPADGPNFGNGGDWNSNQNQNRRGGRARRRNRNKNGPSMNRSPP